MFYARITGTKRPDDIVTGGELLKKGECGFTYFMGAKATDNPSRPIVVTPMISGTDRAASSLLTVTRTSRLPACANAAI